MQQCFLTLKLALRLCQQPALRLCATSLKCFISGRNGARDEATLQDVLLLVLVPAATNLVTLTLINNHLQQALYWCCTTDSAFKPGSCAKSWQLWGVCLGL